MEYMPGDEYVGEYVSIKRTKAIGLVWGYHPSDIPDTPDTLFIQVGDEDWELPASWVTIYRGFINPPEADGLVDDVA